MGTFGGGVILCIKCYDQLYKGELPKLAVANSLDFGMIPLELSVLSDIELRLISLIDAFVTVKRLDSGQYATTDNMVNFYNNMNHLVKKLPRPLDSINIIFVRVAGQQLQEHVVRPTRVRTALHWLVEHNPLYADVIIDEEALVHMKVNSAQPPQVDIKADLMDSLNDGHLNHIVFLCVSDHGARVLVKKIFQKFAKIPNLWVE